MSQINVNTITNLDETGGPVIVGITTVSGNFNVTGVSTISGLTYPTAGPLSNRNLIINGAMQVAQRGTSVAVSDNSNEGYQSLDRYGFFFASTHGGACTISQSTTVPANQGFTNSYKVDITTDSSPTANQSTGIYTKIEAQDVANSGWNFTSTSSFITLSFWARSTLGGTYCVSLDSDDAATYEKYVHEYTLTANTWTKVEVQVPGKSTLAYNNDNGVGTSITWVLSAGSNRNQATNDTWQTGDNQSTSNQVNFFNSTSNDFYLTGVQLEVGSVATPFEHRSFGQEFDLCERYYEKSYDYGTVPGTSTSTGLCSVNATTVSNGYRYYSIEFSTQKRGTPTVVTYAQDGTLGQSTNAAGTNLSANSADVVLPCTKNFAVANNRGSDISVTTNCVAFHYTAEAEL